MMAKQDDDGEDVVNLRTKFNHVIVGKVQFYR